MPTPMVRYLALLLMLVASISSARAEDACSPMRQLVANTPLTLDRYSYELSPKISAQLASDLHLENTGAVLNQLGLAAANTSTTLRSPLSLPDVRVGLVLKDNQAQLNFNPGKGELIVVAGERRFLLSVRDKKVYGQAYNQPLEIQPNLIEPAGLLLPVSTIVTRGADNQLIVAKGSSIQWMLGDSAKPLPLLLQQSAVLEETNVQRSAARITAINPARVLPGGIVAVTMQIANIDLKANPPIFCFYSGSKEAGGQLELIGVQGVAQPPKGDLVTFNVRVPDNLPLRQPPWSWVNPGAPIGLRVLAFGPQTLTIDSSVQLAVASQLRAGVASLVMLSLVVLICLFVLSNRQPLRLLAECSKHNTGRYSLANFQIMLWTVLVLYSLCYVWYATGEILSISSGVLILLGISGTTSVASHGLEAMQNSRVPDTRAAAWIDLITTDGRFDPMRFQMLGFTLFTWLYALVSVLKSEGLPEIPEHLYLLMGISSSSYVASKVPPILAGAPATTAAVAPGDAVLDATTMRQFQAKLKVAQTGVVDDATRDAIVNFKKQNSIIPASPQLDPMLLEKVLKSA